MGDRIAVLNAGIIQQLGSPQQLYDTPANLFVAGFIGSPAMDFFEGRLQKDGSSATVLIGSGDDACTLRLTGSSAEQLSGQATSTGRPVVVGIRPEDFRLADGDAAGVADGTMAGTVDVVEFLGNEQLIYLRLPGVIVPESVKAAKEAVDGVEGGGGVATATQAIATARLGPTARVEPGARVRLAVDTGKMHLFDPATTSRFV